MSKSYIRLTDTQKKVSHRYEKGARNGFHIGFRCLKNLYTVIKGHTTYIGGIPSHGKTEWMWEILINLTEFYGWKHAIFSPETGEAHDIAIEIIKKHQRNQFDPRYLVRMDENNMYESLNEMSEHFFIIDNPTNPEMEYTPDDIMKTVEEIVTNEGEIDTLVIDPFNELKRDFTEYCCREDNYLEYILGKIRRFARKMNIHIFIIVHPRTLHKNKEGIYLPPTAYEFSGGGVWYAKADSIICVHRPYKTDDGAGNKNMANIIIQKAKPKEVGTKGEVELFLDVEKGRYYERDFLIDNYAEKIGSEDDQIKLGKEGVSDLPF